MTEGSLIRLGTRGSPLALVQAVWIEARLREFDPSVAVEIRTIRTTGDRLTGSLHLAGGKGLFLKEIEEALLAGEIDAGVHSMKDLPAELPDGLVIAAVPVREDPRDVLVSGSASGWVGLVRGARIGTGSLRRQALLRHLRPDLDVIGLRGNVGTRLARWRSGELDGVVLAGAGLRRLGMEIPEAVPLDPETFLPAIGQGSLAVEASPDTRWWDLLVRLEDPEARVTATAERGFLSGVSGDCATPIAGLATLAGGLVRLRALVADPAGRRVVGGTREGPVSEADSIGRGLAAEILERGGREVLAGLRR